ncbi:MAG: helix-turn-helix transcriptional regulator [Lachnospiraceae bacterium]|nr:helix-turn-helix transcriptional regulator [Lachnospiraceae bacterium]
MAVSYNKLWKLLIDKNMGRTQMANKAGITGNILGRLSHNEPVSMGSMEKICKCLDCNIGDVMEFVWENEAN